MMGWAEVWKLAWPRRFGTLGKLKRVFLCFFYLISRNHSSEEEHFVLGKDVVKLLLLETSGLKNIMWKEMESTCDFQNGQL